MKIVNWTTIEMIRSWFIFNGIGASLLHLEWKKTAQIVERIDLKSIIHINTHIIIIVGDQSINFSLASFLENDWRIISLIWILNLRVF